MIVVDSSGWIEYFGEGEFVSRYATFIESAEPATHITPVIILYEVYKKLKRERGEEIALKAIAYIITYTRVISLDDRLALASAETSLQHGLAMADAIVKTTADAFTAQLVTSDRDFKGMKNVVFIEK